MARQGSHSQSRQTHKAIAVSRQWFWVSVWLFIVQLPGFSIAQNQAAESARDSTSIGESFQSELKRISLVSGTSLRVVQANEKMPWVFNIQATVDSDDPEAALDPLTLRYSIHRVDFGHRVLSGQREIVANETDQSQTISLDDRSPEDEGIYEVRFQLVRRSSNLWARLRPKETVLEELRVPMLVEVPVSGAMAHVTPWQTIGVIRPSDTAMALGQWLPNSAARLIPGVRHVKGNLQKGDAHGESVSIVQPKSVFQAKLPIMAAGYPHHITIRCPRDQASGLRIDLGQGIDQTQTRFSSLVYSHDASLMSQPTAYHQTDSEYSGDVTTSSDDQWLTRTFLYYPQPDDQVWLTNLNESSMVAFESIEVTAGPTTRMNLRLRQSPADQAMRQVVMSISESNWIQDWTADWQANGESAACEPRSIELCRAWIAAHRAVEQAQKLEASSLTVPSAWVSSTSMEPKQKEWALEKEIVSLRVFERFDVTVHPSVNLNRNQVDSLEQAVQRFKKFRCFGGVVATADQPLEMSDDQLGVLQRVSKENRLLVRANPLALDEKIREQLYGIKNSIPLVNFDCNGSVRATSEHASSGAQGTMGVALNDSLIVHQNPSACLFEVIQRFSPSVILISESVARGTIDDQFSRTCKSFRSMPADSVTEISALDPSDGTCRVRSAVIQDRVVISLSNLAPWESIVKFESVSMSNTASDTTTRASALLSDKVLWERIDDGSFQSFNGSKLNQGLNVPARDTVLLRSRFPVPQRSLHTIASWRWSGGIAGGSSIIEQIKKDVTGIVERMGMLSDPAANGQLTNGSFETVGEVGLVGWLHAQHPPGCVTVDLEVASDGSKSVRLKTDRSVSARTWLVSDTIAAPASGRLAISMALRGEELRSDDHSNVDALSNQRNQIHPTEKEKPKENSLHLRVSLEGNQSGVPIRKSADVEIPRSGLWEPRRVVLEANSLAPSTTDSLRLTIDSMTPGLIWVDDVRIHDDFSTTRERTDLQTQAFLAVEGLQRGNLTPSAKLLTNRWSGRLLEMSHGAEKQAEKPSLSSESGNKPFGRNVPEIANRNRAWLLERLRL